MPPAESIPLESFITRWNGTERAERANYALFLSELCEVLGVERPEPARGGDGPYRFERSVVHHDDEGRTSTRRIDLYRRGCFVLEAKQGANAAPQAELFGENEAGRRQAGRNSRGWAQHMLHAKGQAEGYVRDLPPQEPSPPVPDRLRCRLLLRVQRLVLPTVMEPLRTEWDSYKAAADLKLRTGDREGASAVIRAFHGRLCGVRVLEHGPASVPRAGEEPARGAGRGARALDRLAAMAFPHPR